MSNIFFKFAKIILLIIFYVFSYYYYFSCYQTYNFTKERKYMDIFCIQLYMFLYIYLYSYMKLIYFFIRDKRSRRKKEDGKWKKKELGNERVSEEEKNFSKDKFNDATLRSSRSFPLSLNTIFVAPEASSGLLTEKTERISTSLPPATYRNGK